MTASPPDPMSAAPVVPTAPSAPAPEPTPAPRPLRHLVRRAALALTYASAAAAFAFALVRAFGLEVTWPVRVLMAYTPQLALAALVPPAAALLLRRRRVALAALLAPLLLLSLLVPRAFADAQPGATGPSLTVASSNMLLGGGDAAGLVDLVDRHHVDVLSLQELTAVAVDRLVAAGLAERLPYRELTALDGAEGTGVFSRYPLTRDPGLEFAATFQMTGVSVAVPGAPPVELLAAHPAAPWQAAQVDFWLGDLAKLPPATPDGAVRILAGDFNATLDHAAFRDVLDRGYVDAAASAGEGLNGTWKPRAGSRLDPFGVVPRVALDHVLVDERVAVRGFAVSDLAASDHNPVIADLVLPAQ